MKLTKFILSNGIESYIIDAEDNKILVRNDGVRFGISLTLGLKFRDKDGNVLSEPIYEQPSDYTEEDMTDEELERYNSLLNETVN